MAIQTITPQSPITLLTLEEQKPSKFSKMDSFKSLNNPFKKIALAVVHIFTALREWVYKPFSTNITIAKSEKTVEVKPNESKLESLVKCEPVSKPESAASLSPDEIKFIKDQYVFIKQLEYTKKYEEKTGKLPTDEHFLKVFNDKKLKQLHKKVDKELEKLAPEDVKKVKARYCQIKKLLENTSSQEQLNSTSTVTSHKVEVNAESLVDRITKKITPQLCLGLGVGVATMVTGYALASYASANLLEPLIQGAQTLSIGDTNIGGKITTGLQIIALWTTAKRAWNGMKMAMPGWEFLGKELTLPKFPAACSTVACSIGFFAECRNILNCINNPKIALFNEGRRFLHRKIITHVDRAVQFGCDYLLKKDSDLSQQKTFEGGYRGAQTVVSLALNAQAAFTVALGVAFWLGGVLGYGSSAPQQLLEA